MILTTARALGWVGCSIRRRDVCEWLLSAEVGLGAAQLQADGDGNTPARMAR